MVLPPEVSVQLTYTDTQGLPTWFDFPQGMVGITMTVTVTPTVASGNGGLAFAGHAFDMGLRTAW